MTIFGTSALTTGTSTYCSEAFVSSASLTRFDFGGRTVDMVIGDVWWREEGGERV